MASVSTMLDLLGRLSTPALKVHAQRCVLVRNANASCLKCADVCAGGCISYDGEDLQIDLDSCIGCGTCASACPTCAIEAQNPTDDELFLACITARDNCEGNVCIACSRVFDAYAGKIRAGSVARVECLGRIDESLMCALFASDVKDVALVGGECATCERKCGHDWACEVLSLTDELRELWAVEACAHLQHKLPAYTRAADEGFDVGKRGALFDVRDAGKSLVAQGVDEALGKGADKDDPVLEKFPKVGDDGTLEYFIPRRRRTLLGALSALGEPADEMIECRLWGHVVIDTQVCSGCLMCTVFCPTGALRKHDGQDFGADYSPGMCVKCKTCQNICPTGAIDFSEAVFAREILANKTDTYIMNEPAVKRGNAHTILNLAKGMFNTTQVFER